MKVQSRTIKILQKINNDIYCIMANFGIEDYTTDNIKEMMKQTKMKNEDIAYSLCKSPERIKDYKAGRMNRKTRVIVGRELRKLIN